MLVKCSHVNGISAILSVIAGLLSPLYFQYFVQVDSSDVHRDSFPQAFLLSSFLGVQLAASCAPRFHHNVFKCKRISETGAQQASTPAGYTRYVAREMSKAEHLLKVILSPMKAIADTYHALPPDGSDADFQRILDLKGVKRKDSQPLIDRFTNRNIEGLPTLHIQQPGSWGTATTTPSFASSGQQSTKAMMSRNENCIG